MRVLPGSDYPLGASVVEAGTNFAVASDAESVTLCLLDAAGVEQRVPLPERRGDVWHGLVPGVVPGQAYGYRVSGPDGQPEGRHDPGKLLLDPYARAITGSLTFADEVYGDSRGDSAPYTPRSLVVAPGPPPAPGPRRRLADTVIYETHVKGLTMTHPRVPEGLRGTYAGLAHPAVVEHLVQLGVTAVELLPIHHHAR